MISCDSHLHTDFSTDSEAPVEAQMMRAIELGLKHMYFTDHMDVDFPGGQFVFDIEPYFEKLLPLQRAFPVRSGSTSAWNWASVPRKRSLRKTSI